MKEFVCSDLKVEDMPRVHTSGIVIVIFRSRLGQPEESRSAYVAWRAGSEGRRQGRWNSIAGKADVHLLRRRQGGERGFHVGDSAHHEAAVIAPDEAEVLTVVRALVA